MAGWYCAHAHYLPEELHGLSVTRFVEAVLAEVRQAGISIMTNRHLGIKSFAVPVLDSNGMVCASLGLTMPLSRLPEDGGEHIVTELRRANTLLMRKLSLGGFAAGDFLR